MTEPVATYWQLVEPVYERINLYDGPEVYAASLEGIPRSVVLLHAAHMCQSEVRNGGFLQLFWNNTGVLVPEAVEGLRTIAMPEAAALLAVAAAPLGKKYPRDRDDRWDALLASSGKNEEELKRIFEGNENLYLAFEEATRGTPLDTLNKRFWECLEAENGGFEDAATRYARAPFLIQ
jgi:hypothetical protein